MSFDDTALAMVTVPNIEDLMWPTLRALKEMGGSGTNEELLAKIIQLEEIPSEVQAIQHTDHRQSRLNYNLAWAKTHLKKVGAVDNSSRGVWAITKEGENLAEDEVKLIRGRVRKQVAEARRERQSVSPDEDSSG